MNFECVVLAVDDIVVLGTATGLAIIDTVQYTLICAWSSVDLYGKQLTPVLLNQSVDSGSRDVIFFVHGNVCESSLQIENCV